MPDPPPSPKNYDEYLLEISWKGISFPITNLSTKMDHDLATHKYPDRDGAHIESTGRNPIEVSCSALFHNHISRGRTETWKFGNLFPTVFNDFMTACMDRKVGQLQHPILGTFDAKCQHANVQLDAHQRGGVTVEVGWIETIYNELDKSPQPSGSKAVAEAIDLVDQLSKAALFQPTLATKLPKKESLLDQIDKIKGFIDQISLFGMKNLATINRLLYHVDNLLFSVKRFNSVTFAPTILAANKLKSSLIELREATNAAIGPVCTTTVDSDTTMGSLSSRLGNNVVQLIKLNPKTAAKPVIKAGTVIRYYKVI